MIVAIRGDILRQQPAKRSHVGSELPDLIVGDLSAEGRHAIRPPLENAVINLIGLVAVAPFVVAQRRADAAPAVRMAADAVVRAEQLLAVADGCWRCSRTAYALASLASPPPGCRSLSTTS